MRRNFIVSAALAVALTLPALAYAESTVGEGAANGSYAKPSGSYGKHSHRAMMHATHRHYADRRQAYRAGPPASGGSAGVPGGGGCDPAASSASASAPVGQAAPGCK
jgi:hypothetical protein